jgi:adenosylcobinamide-phosphate synthase
VVRGLAIAAGLAADSVFGEPPVRPHPVSLFGKAMHQLEARIYADRRGRGVAHAVTGTVMGFLAGRVVRSTAVATYIAVAGRALADAARDVGSALDRENLAEARRLLPALVGRDTSELDEGEIARAVVESLAENTVDAVVAPAMWALVFGASGALGYRAINTMDSVVGHRSERYLRYGWASARLDDVANFLPARVAAVLVVAVRPQRANEVWEVVRRDAASHPSPNAGVVEAAFAAALGLRLGGQNRYEDRIDFRPTLGNGRAPRREDIERAISLSRDVTAMFGLLTAGLRRG